MAGLSYREAVPDGESRGDVLLLHGFPESSYMWRHVMPGIAEAGWRAIAPDLAGFGDSPVDLPGTWERHVDSVAQLYSDLGLERVVLACHDWGGLIGLRWLCSARDAARGLVVSGTGYFPDGRWHGFAEVLRTPGDGEAAMDAMTKEVLAEMLRALGSGFDDAAVDEYWRGFADADRRRSILDFYRSCEFVEIASDDGCLEALDVPALLLWGERDPFAPIGGAHRFMRLLPDAHLTVVPETGHFVFEDAPQETAAAIADYLRQL